MKHKGLTVLICYNNLLYPIETEKLKNLHKLWNNFLFVGTNGYGLLVFYWSFK